MKKFLLFFVLGITLIQLSVAPPVNVQHEEPAAHHGDQEQPQDEESIVSLPSYFRMMFH